MKKQKRILLFVLCLLMTVCVITGCGLQAEDGKETVSPGGGTAEKTPTPEELSYWDDFFSKYKEESYHVPADEMQAAFDAAPEIPLTSLTPCTIKDCEKYFAETDHGSGWNAKYRLWFFSGMGDVSAQLYHFTKLGIPYMMQLDETHAAVVYRIREETLGETFLYVIFSVGKFSSDPYWVTQGEFYFGKEKKRFADCADLKVGDSALKADLLFPDVIRFEAAVWKKAFQLEQYNGFEADCMLEDGLLLLWFEPEEGYSFSEEMEPQEALEHHVLKEIRFVPEGTSRESLQDSEHFNLSIRPLAFYGIEDVYPEIH